MTDPKALRRRQATGGQARQNYSRPIAGGQTAAVRYATNVYVEQEFEMTSRPTPPLLAGYVLEISFATFTPRITIHSERQLTVEIIAGDGTGFSDTVEYEAVAIRDDLVVLSWQEHIGSTVVHVLELSSSRAYTAVTPAKGGFMRLTGRVEVKSEP